MVVYSVNDDVDNDFHSITWSIDSYEVIRDRDI